MLIEILHEIISGEACRHEKKKYIYRNVQALEGKSIYSYFIYKFLRLGGGPLELCG